LVVMVELVLVRMEVAQPEDWPPVETAVALSAQPALAVEVVVRDYLVVVVVRGQMLTVVGPVEVVGPVLRLLDCPPLPILQEAVLTQVTQAMQPVVALDRVAVAEPSIQSGLVVPEDLSISPLGQVGQSPVMPFRGPS